ncbi:Crp/Fnr family transcriptional regulator [Pigmentiphaga aceris]|uniref:Crp/Fnr family transcriptional regulator n=1 Tax=Pigmentiphaga aceris TaxID=1940612 RepID=A0A5C0AYN0_9BURK|nr:Crp/Fnr family transcriptional regulator [Pigmentiphaga aceris]QEI07529.1 Crp/Fnr family transcriptional regulator [Pigmentiphaga aceris]
MLCTKDIERIKADWRACVWSHTLTDVQATQLLPTIQIASVPAGGYIWRRGDTSDHWVGMVSGSMKLCSTSPAGKSVTYTGMAYGWIGEDGIVSGGARNCDAVALIDAVIAKMPAAVFLKLLEENPAFNRFVMRQMSERTQQFMELTAFEKMLDPVAKVARSLGALFNPWFFPPHSLELKVTQAEVADFCNMSRSRVSIALKQLEREGLVKVAYSGTTVVDLDGLRRYAEV